MPREVTVACENPRASAKEERAKVAYDRAVEGALRRAGYPKSAVDWTYIDAVRKTGVDPRTAAALALRKPHEHAVIGIAAEAKRKKAMPAPTTPQYTLEDYEAALLETLKEMHRQRPEEALFPMRELREEVAGLTKEDFDRAAIALQKKGDVVMYYHDRPWGVSADERAQFVRDRDHFYNAIYLARRPAKMEEAREERPSADPHGLERFGKGPAIYTKDVFPGGFDGSVGGLDPIAINKAIERAPIRDIKLVDAVATQPTVRKEGVAYFLDGGEAPDDELPQAVFYGGRYYLRNGTTRAAAAILAGKKTLRGRVLDWPSDEAREDRPAPAPTDGGFAKVVKDPAAWAAVLARAREVGPLDNDRQVIRFLRGEGIDKQDQEVFWVVGLDSHNSLRTLAEVARGQRDRVAVDVADVTRPVLLEGCRAFLVAHNHPAGDPAPSDSDKAITAKLREAAAASNVVFLDHLVLGTGKYYSFADKKTKAG